VTQALARVRIFGIGNRYRGDDAAGIEVALRLRDEPLAGATAVSVRDGDPSGLLDAWTGAETVIVVDAVRSGAPAGTVHRRQADARPLGGALASVSSHALSLGDVIELARTIDRLPPRLIVYGIEADSLETGAAMTPAVRAAVSDVVRLIQREVERWLGTPPRR